MNKPRSRPDTRLDTKINTTINTPPATDPIVVESYYPVSPGQVYEAWTNPVYVARWFGSQQGPLHEAAIDLRPGGRWRFVEYADERGSAGFEGEYVDIEPNRLLVFTWTKVTSDPSGSRTSTPTSRVEIRFTDTEEGTHMRIEHSNLDPESRSGFTYGWKIGMNRLRTHLDP